MSFFASLLRCILRALLRRSFSALNSTSHLQVDVTLNNTLAIINTKLLADYCAIDGRLTQLAFIVKHWAKRRQVWPPLPAVPSGRSTPRSQCGLLHEAGLRNWLERVAARRQRSFCRRHSSQPLCMDPELLPCYHAFRFPCRCLQVNDAYRGTLSSYGYVLMCIHLLQQRQPSVLPCLHNIRPHTHVRRASLGMLHSAMT